MINAGWWLTLREWIDWESEQEPVDNSLIYGLGELYRERRVPYCGSLGDRPNTLPSYRWADEQWWEYHNPNMTLVDGAEVDVEDQHDPDTVHLLTGLVFVTAPPTCHGPHRLPHHIAVRLADKGHVFKAQEVGGEVMTLIREMPVYHSLEEAYRAAAYAYADHRDDAISKTHDWVKDK